VTLKAKRRQYRIALNTVANLSSPPAREWGRLGRARILPPVLVRHPDCIRIGDDVVVQENVWFSVVRAFPDIEPRLVIEDGVWVGRGSAFGVAGECIVERGAVIGDFAMIVDTIHPPETRDRADAVARPAPVRIGAGAVLGTHVVVLPGVTIGAGARVEHQSVVAKDVPPGARVAGYPARVVK
jgi:acetyltransferase-like isoleucine patch superfamily enzyme